MLLESGQQQFLRHKRQDKTDFIERHLRDTMPETVLARINFARQRSIDNRCQTWNSKKQKQWLPSPPFGHASLSPWHNLMKIAYCKTPSQAALSPGKSASAMKNAAGAKRGRHFQARAGGFTSSPAP
ncbi:hypothetical protein [Chromobacterium sp. LK1]|uniref:hypothetical protein n=1 Tax=Chromobacterium sp. LK1 TaxID=1628193 RepID=UPI0012E1892A|nr:hypothetical protein [Chromobacterium sp. LK1]